MLRKIIILLLAIVIGLGSTLMLYPEEIGGMIAMLTNPDNGQQTDKPPVVKDPDVVSLAVDASAAKTTFAFDEEFTTEGLIITATMSDGTTKQISPDDCKITKPDTTKAGTRQIAIMYGGISARYEVTVLAKVYPAIPTESLVDITAKNESAPYRVEAEAIDMATPGAKLAEGCESFVATAPEGAAITSGEQYLTGYGVKWNYFGFTFTAAEKYESVTLVLRVANNTANDIDAGAVKMYLNMEQAENGTAQGAIPLEGYIIEADGECNWSDIVIRNLTIPQGTNTLTFEVQDKNIAFDIDYVDFYVGMRYINSVVEINDTTTIVKDLEALDTEKAFTRQDVANAHGLKPGQLFVEPTKESPGKTTSGGTAVGAIGNGSQMSTTIRLAQDATVLIKFKASKVGAGAYYVKDNWNFYIDGVKLTTVERLNIEGGDSSKGLWWDWIYTDVGAINLTAGDHFFLLEVHGVDCNVDTVEFEILSLGSFDDSGVNLEDMAKPAPVIDKEIDKTGTYVFEAENLDKSNLKPSDGWEDKGVQIETPNTPNPATSGGKSIGACGGGYTTITFELKDKATIQVYGRIAHAHGGEASSYMSMKLGDTELLASGNVPAGDNATSMYWNWVDAPFGGPLTLEAGVYTLTVNFLKNPNFDCVKIDVISYGEEKPFAVIEAETFDDEGVVTRQDMIDAGRIPAGQYMSETGNGATCICGFTSGTWFKFNFNVESAMTLEMFLVGATDAQGYDVSTKFSVKVNGTTITSPSGLLTGSGSTPYWDWQTVSLGIVSLQAGDNEIVLTVLDGHPNLDKVFFLESDGEVTVPPHECESVCSKCGKCTDAACTETACASKCEGHQVVADITITDANDSYKVEAEKLDMSTLVPQAGFAVPVVENFDGGQGLGGIGAGGYQTFVVTSEKNATVKLCISFANANGGSILNFIPAIYVNGEAISLLDGQIPAGIGTPQESPSKFYWNVADVHIATLELKAGETYTIKIMVNQGNLDGYALQVVDASEVPTHKCESVCAECGKCTDSACTESACASKCEGHQVTYDVVINANTTYTLEAENWSQDNMAIRSDLANHAAKNGNRLLENNGTTIGGMAAGSYITFNVYVQENSTVAFVMKAADSVDFIVNQAMSITIDGVAVELCNANLKGSGSAPWFDWTILTVGYANISAGEHTIVVKYIEKSSNVDYLKLDVMSYGSYSDSDVTIATSGTTKYELENIDCAQCLINTRSDFIPSVGEGNCGKGSGRIYGYSNDSIFRVVVTVEQACTLEIKLAGFGGGALNAQQYYFGGTEIIPADGAALGNGAVAEGLVGTVTVSEAGTYVFEFTSGGGTDLDYVSFTVVE